MDFTTGFAAEGFGRRGEFRTIDSTQRFLTDNHRALLRLRIGDDLTGTVNFVIGEYTVLEDEPAGPPSPPVIHPLVQYSGDSIPHHFFDLHGGQRILRGGPPVSLGDGAQPELGPTPRRGGRTGRPRRRRRHVEEGC